MWLLNWLPDWIFHLMIAVGIVGTLAGLYFRRIPVTYQIPVVVVSVLLIVAGVWYSGGIAKDREYQLQIAELQLKVAAAERRAAEANARIEYVYQDRVQVVEKIRYRVISAIRESSNELDANCRVIPQAVDILNQAAKSDPGEPE